MLEIIFRLFLAASRRVRNCNYRSGDRSALQPFWSRQRRAYYRETSMAPLVGLRRSHLRRGSAASLKISSPVGHTACSWPSIYLQASVIFELSKESAARSHPLGLSEKDPEAPVLARLAFGVGVRAMPHAWSRPRINSERRGLVLPLSGRSVDGRPFVAPGAHCPAEYRTKGLPRRTAALRELFWRERRDAMEGVWRRVLRGGVGVRLSRIQHALRD